MMEKENPPDPKEQPAPKFNWGLYLVFVSLIFLYLTYSNRPPSSKNPLATEGNQTAKTENPLSPTKDIPDDDCDAFYKKARETADYRPDISVALSSLHQSCLARKKK